MFRSIDEIMRLFWQDNSDLDEVLVGDNEQLSIFFSNGDLVFKRPTKANLIEWLRDTFEPQDFGVLHISEGRTMLPAMKMGEYSKTTTIPARFAGIEKMVIKSSEVWPDAFGEEERFVADFNKWYGSCLLYLDGCMVTANGGLFVFSPSNKNKLISVADGALDKLNAPKSLKENTKNYRIIDGKLYPPSAVCPKCAELLDIYGCCNNRQCGEWLPF